MISLYEDFLDMGYKRFAIGFDGGTAKQSFENRMHRK